MISPSQIPNPYVKPKWQAPVGVMESVVAYNCRKYGMPRPVLTMPMWEGGGNRVIDLSGQGNHGTIIGADWVAEGLSFIDTNSDQVKITNVTHASYPITLFITINLDKHISYGRIMEYVDGSGTASTIAHGNTEGIIGAGEISNQKTYEISLDVISHITVVFNSQAYVDVYVDGVPAIDTGAGITALAQGTTPSGAACICSRWTEKYIDANVYGAGMFNVALSAAQVKFLYDNPYFMYRLPEELYGYAAAAGVTMPVFMSNYLRQMGV